MADEQDTPQQGTRGIERVVRKVRLGEEPSDFEYWQAQPYEARIAALEEIRRVSPVALWWRTATSESLPTGLSH
jgi:hypothetical protein